MNVELRQYTKPIFVNVPLSFRGEMKINRENFLGKNRENVYNRNRDPEISGLARRKFWLTDKNVPEEV